MSTGKKYVPCHDKQEHYLEVLGKKHREGEIDTDGYDSFVAFVRSGGSKFPDRISELPPSGKKETYKYRFRCRFRALVGE